MIPMPEIHDWLAFSERPPLRSNFCIDSPLSESHAIFNSNPLGTFFDCEWREHPKPTGDDFKYIHSRMGNNLCDTVPKEWLGTVWFGINQNTCVSSCLQSEALNTDWLLR